jgi:hypothetical protein
MPGRPQLSRLAKMMGQAYQEDEGGVEEETGPVSTKWSAWVKEITTFRSLSVMHCWAFGTAWIKTDGTKRFEVFTVFALRSNL